MCAGPKRAPGLNETPLSNGTPMILTSARGTWSTRGSSANVAAPANLGVSEESVGPTGPVVTLDHLCVTYELFVFENIL